MLAISRLERLVETSSTFFKKYAFSPSVRGSRRGEGGRRKRDQPEQKGHTMLSMIRNQTKKQPRKA
jgi:hypothetical protein